MPSDDEVVPEMPATDDSGQAPGQVYVRLSEDRSGVASVSVRALPIYGQEDATRAASSVTSTGIDDLDAALNELGVSGLYRLVDDQQAAVADAGGAERGASSSLGSIILVQFDETKPVDEAMSTLSALDSVAEVSPVGIFTIALAVDDPEFPRQWALPDVRVPEAWDTTTGESSVVVAIVDTGCDATHVDLAPILDGASFVGAPAGQDDHGHGTHVAGIVAALGNNGTDVAGIAWGCWILPVRVFNASGSTVGPSVAQGIAYAASNARIINCSIQSGVDDVAVRTAVADAIANGVLVVAAMGNFGWNAAKPSYPAAHPGVLAVGAVGRDHQRAVWSSTQSSNTGPWNTVVAPGTDILSLATGGGTTLKSGTSQAAPHVAGVAALLASARPDLTATDIWNAIYQSAVILKDSDSDPVPNDTYGGGIVDAQAALEWVGAAAPVGDFVLPPDDGTRVAEGDGSAEGDSEVSAEEAASA